MVKTIEARVNRVDMTEDKAILNLAICSMRYSENGISQAPREENTPSTSVKIEGTSFTKNSHALQMTKPQDFVIIKLSDNPSSGQNVVAFENQTFHQFRECVSTGNIYF